MLHTRDIMRNVNLFELGAFATVSLQNEIILAFYMFEGFTK